MENYKWLKVVREKIGSSKTNSARYKDGIITLFDYFYTYSEQKQKAVLEHEFAHHTFNTMPKKVKLFWIGISKMIKQYTSNHAKKNYYEDFGECIEAIVEWKKFSWMLALKVNIAKKLYKKYSMEAMVSLFTEKYNGKPVDYDGVYWHQCVDLVKQWSDEFLLSPLWTFGGSAKTWWYNKENTFPEDKWEKYTNDKPWVELKVGDILFWTYWEYWHTAVCVWVEWDTVIMFEQNVWNGDGKWKDDYCKIEITQKAYISWWYRRIWQNGFYK